MRRRVIAAAGLCFLLPLHVGAQRFTVVREPLGTAVGVSVVLNAGSAWEADSEAGAVRLAGEAILEGMRPELDALGARARFECARGSVQFTLLVPPTTWRDAAHVFLQAILRSDISENALELARAEVLHSLAADVGNPAVEAHEATYGALFGAQHRWARPSCGRIETVSVLSAATVRRIALTRFSAGRATAAVAGPIAANEAGAIFREALGDVELPVIQTMPQGQMAAEARLVDTPTVTAWVSLAFALPRDPDDEAARLLAHLLREAAAPVLERPEIVDVQTRVERWGGGGALFVHLITEPQHARRWQQRIELLVRQTASVGVPLAAFGELRRRFTGTRLLELDTPEARAGEAAGQLFFDEAYVDPVQRLESLDTARLQRIARALGSPASVILGPAELLTPP